MSSYYYQHRQFENTSIVINGVSIPITNYTKTATLPRNIPPIYLQYNGNYFIIQIESGSTSKFNNLITSIRKTGRAHIVLVNFDKFTDFNNMPMQFDGPKTENGNTPVLYISTGTHLLQRIAFYPAAASGFAQGGMDMSWFGLLIILAIIIIALYKLVGVEKRAVDGGRWG